MCVYKLLYVLYTHTAKQEEEVEKTNGKQLGTTAPEKNERERREKLCVTKE